MVVDATGTITIKVVGGTPPPPSEIPWWLIGLAGVLGVATVVVATGKGKKRKRR